MTTRPKILAVYFLMACRFGAAAGKSAVRLPSGSKVTRSAG
ncbi:hypothetical protein REH65_28435 [Saccharopolyspora sp. ID03-671]